MQPNMPRMIFKTQNAIFILHIYIYISTKSVFLFNGCGFKNTIKLYKNSDLSSNRIELLIVLFLYSIFNCLFAKTKCLE